MIIFLAVLIFLAAGTGVFLFQQETRSRKLLERKFREVNEELRRAFQRLEEERARLETTFSGMIEGVLVTDQKGDILHANPAFREMFQLKEKIEGRSAIEVTASVVCDDAIQEVLKEGKPVEREVKFEKPNGRTFQIFFSPMRKEGKIFGVVSVFHDITEMRRLETIRRDFVANLSHELKTPLTAIRGYAETLHEDSGKIPEESRQHAEIIFRHAADLSQLTENLLNLSKIESGKEEIYLEDVPLKSFVDRLFERFASQAKTKRIKLENQISDSKFFVQADANKLTQILGNLVDNAIKYTPEGSRLSIRAKNGTRIEVEDNGPGIPLEDQERIFERFYRVDKARSRDSGGAGLGLAIVKHLVELHGGSIQVESLPGRGSKFTIFFPAPTQNPAKVR